MEAPASHRLPSSGMRFVVQRTFLEVVEDDGDQSPGAALRRSMSAPVAPRTRGKTSSETECLDSPAGVSQLSQEAKGQEPKTTVAIRSIPIHLTRDQLLQYLDARGFAGRYDFLYLPIDFAKRQNFGYAFVNCTTAEHARRVFAELKGTGWGEHGEGQVVVGWSLTQGLDSHIERYRNSPVMHESTLDECKPIVLEGGVRVDFPPPTKKVQRIRRLRTRCTTTGGRCVSSSALHAIFGTEAPQVCTPALLAARPEDDAHAAPAGCCVLLPGLSSAPSGTGQEADAILASPLLAGLTEALGEVPARAAAPPRRKAAWADLRDDDLDSGCSTRAPSCFGRALSSASEGSGGSSSEGPAAGRRGRAAPPGHGGSVLAQGLTASPPGEQGARPPARQGMGCLAAGRPRG